MRLRRVARETLDLQALERLPMARGVGEQRNVHDTPSVHERALGLRAFCCLSQAKAMAHFSHIMGA